MIYILIILLLIQAIRIKKLEKQVDQGEWRYLRAESRLEYLGQVVEQQTDQEGIFKMLNNKRSNKFLMIVLILIIAMAAGGVVQAGVSYVLGNDDANITFKQAGKSNVYDLQYNVSTTNKPLFEIYNGVDYMMLKSFGKDFIMYSDSAGRTILQGEIYTEEGRILTDADGITTKLELEGYTLIIVDGLIVDIEGDE